VFSFSFFFYLFGEIKGTLLFLEKIRRVNIYIYVLYYVTCMVSPVMELIGPRYRACVGIVVMLAWSFGLMLLPLIAFFVRDDVKFQLAVIGPRFPLLLITL